ncbi:MAG: hypothetical protein ABFS45_08180 [Pseudomonadota bacterium]
MEFPRKLSSFPYYPNVQLDPASAYQWNELNETEFLFYFFQCLHEEMGPAFHAYNFFIFSSHDPEVIPSSAYSYIPNKILFFISDESSSVRSIYYALQLQASYQYIFKSYLPSELPHTRVFPFQLGYVRDVPRLQIKSIKDRSNDIFFSGNLNPNRVSMYNAVNPVTRALPSRFANWLIRHLHPTLRCQTLDKCIRLSVPNSRIAFTDGFKHGLAGEEYARLLHDSKIALCPKGFISSETFRHIEAMRSGTVIISEELPSTPFYRGSPIVVVRDWRFGLSKAKRLLKSPDFLADLQTATLNWWEEVCSERATAKYVWDIIRTHRASLPGV